VVHGWLQQVNTYPVDDDGAPVSVPVRLIIVKAPERKPDLAAYQAAKADLQAWPGWSMPGLHVTTYELDNWGRLLGDVWAGERGNTATQWMLQRGWPIHPDYPDPR
jgi:endonuclease YncB( thermonuclease family)